MKTLCVIAGDGIGPEVVPVAVDALQRLMPGLRLNEFFLIHLEKGFSRIQRLL